MRESEVEVRHTVVVDFPAREASKQGLTVTRQVPGSSAGCSIIRTSSTLLSLFARIETIACIIICFQGNLLTWMCLLHPFYLPASTGGWALVTALIVCRLCVFLLPHLAAMCFLCYPQHENSTVVSEAGVRHVRSMLCCVLVTSPLSQKLTILTLLCLTLCVWHFHNADRIHSCWSNTVESLYLKWKCAEWPISLAFSPLSLIYTLI